jgi:hypothetical protein
MVFFLSGLAGLEVINKDLDLRLDGAKPPLPYHVTAP